MPKRPNARTRDEEIEHIRKKILKLEKKMQNIGSDLSDEDGVENKDMYEVVSNDWLSIIPEDDKRSVVSINQLLEPSTSTKEDSASLATPQETPTSAEPRSLEGPEIELDTDILEILGDDPSDGEILGKNIRQELACRLTHTTREGLSKETRKELMAKYPVPANCLLIGAPKINPEIKITMPEQAAKRDKGIKIKQTQMANAISCLAELISAKLTAKDQDKDTLAKLMDAIRLLCDIQHGDSVTRRNFILFTVKRDLKEHLSATKIDSLLFGETLSETLKTAKSINKSGVELKADPPPKNLPRKPKSNHLNRRAPGPAYRQTGPSRRSYEPATYRSAAPPQQPVYLSRQWPRPPLPPPPPPPPLPPPAQATARRRY